ncbi:MAG: hypothetical protein DRJ38_02165 [Thermoprotei archaeon]|nr:MAG: hypothetical protein DRJ38_02165 [Thermoprotei archaeon]
MSERIRICVSLESESPWLVNKILQNLVEKGVDLAEVKIPISGEKIGNLERVIGNYSSKLIVKPVFENRHGFPVLKRVVEQRPFYLELDIDVTRRFPEILDLVIENDVFLMVSIDYGHSPSVDELVHDVIRALNQSDLVKVTFPAENYEDNLKVLEVYKSLREDSNRMVIVAKNEKGYLSQLLLPLLGAPFTVASTDEEKNSSYINYRAIQVFYGILNSLKS